MKLPYQWLKDFTDIGIHNVDAKTYADSMTMSGSMVGSWDSPADEIKNVVVGQILKLEKHPNSDHLTICQVNVGKETLQIVTGASNLKEGDIVPAALDGAKLPGGIEIKNTVMRGESSCGMLCSMGELGLTEHDCPYGITNGILVLPEEMGAQPGDDICKVLGLDDIIFDFDILHNRPDCLSVIGLARESAATFGKSFHVDTPAVKNTTGDIRDYLAVDIEDPNGCPRYCAAMAKNIKIQPSPKWMRDRLRNAGIRPINNIVDITNYVMLEYGQPMHAFDYRCIEQNHIIVRRSHPGETTVTLDGQTRELWENTLLITDPVKCIGIAGVMGGENSEITENTQMIVFESATFDCVSVRTSSRKMGMRTEASGRFEKGLNCENNMAALIRACQLVEELGAGEIIGGIIDAYPEKKQHRVLKLDAQRIASFIGADIPEEFMRKTLVDLGFELNGDDVIVPFWRDDVEGIADLAEEVARYYGYDRIPTTLFAGVATKGGLNPKQTFEHMLSDACMSIGFTEAKTLSFMSGKAFDKIAMAKDDPRRAALVITNPLGEDQSMMRTTALPAMLETVSRNYNYRATSLRLFEQACIYLPKVVDGKADANQLPDERKILTMALYDGDFFTMKGCLESILCDMNIQNIRFIPCKTNPSYHPGRCAEIYCQNQLIGYAGQVHPVVLDNYDIGTETYVAELDMGTMYALVSPKSEYHPLPKYPAVTRDLALVCDESQYVLQLADVIRKAAGTCLEDVALFDVYRSNQLGENKKSLAFSLTLRSPDHTMTDVESEAIIQNILTALAAELNVTIRA